MTELTSWSDSSLVACLAFNTQWDEQQQVRPHWVGHYGLVAIWPRVPHFGGDTFPPARLMSSGKSLIAAAERLRCANKEQRLLHLGERYDEPPAAVELDIRVRRAPCVSFFACHRLSFHLRLCAYRTVITVESVSPLDLPSDTLNYRPSLIKVNRHSRLNVKATGVWST